MAKEFALEELARNGSTINWHELRFVPLRLLMEGAGDQFFAGPTLSNDENGCV